MPQPLYFALGAALFFAPVVASRVGSSAKRRWAAVAVSGTALSFVLVSHFSYAHPYLLADNRHFTFYLWRRFLDPAGRGVYLAPAYGLALAMLDAATQHWGMLRQVAFAGSCVVALAPAPLFEPRYFVPPLVFLGARLVEDEGDWRVLAAQLAGFASVDAAVLALFALRPLGPDGRDHFMW